MSVEFSLSVQYASEASDLPTRAQVRRWVAAALAHPAEITVRIVDADEARALNQDFRSKAYVPNVLTFEYGEIGHDESGHGILGGDVVICAPVVEREAREQGKTAEAHWAHLVIHGCLHLLGYDHLEDEEAEEMEALERELLAELGHPDPYAEE